MTTPRFDYSTLISNIKSPEQLGLSSALDTNILNNLNLLNNINFFKFIDINNILFHPLFTIERTDDHIIVTDYKIIKF